MILNELEHHWRISMPILKKKGFLRGFKSGPYGFHDSRTGNTGYISIEVACNKDDGGFIRFQYRYQFSDGWHDLDYSMPLTISECNYGGTRFWFRCNHTKDDGSECGNHVAHIYLKGGYFACRKCHELVYEWNNFSGHRKKIGRVIPRSELQTLGKSVKKFFYRNRPTKRFKRYVEKKKRSEAAIEGIFGSLQSRFDKVGKDFGFKI